MRLIRISLIFLLFATIAVPPSPIALAQSQAPPVSLSALVEQALALFPRLDGEVLEVQGSVLTLSVGQEGGARPGLAVQVVREGREIRHPRTGELLGRAEQRLGQAVISQAGERFSLAEHQGEPAQPGDRVRTPASVKLTLVSLVGPGVKPNLAEAVTGEVYEGLKRTGRFQIVFGEQVAVWLGQEKIAYPEFLQGRGVREVAARFSTENLLVLHHTLVERKPFLEARLFTMARPEAALTTAFFVPPSLKPAEPGRFSASGQAAPAPQRKPRSLLARLLGWGDETVTGYSSAEAGIPLKEIARLPFNVVSMDVAVAPADGVPRVALTDGQKVYVYRIVEQTFEPEWTYHPWAVGGIISVQLADLTGQGRLEVVVNRFDTRLGMTSFIVGLRDGRPKVLADRIDAILLAVDEQARPVKRTLWAQRYRAETFFARGQVDEMALEDGGLRRVRAVAVPDVFRATGAAFSTVNGKDRPVLVYIDEHNHLRITSGLDELWRSGSQVGGGGDRIEVVRMIERGGRSFFYRMEPIPLSVDLDGDGVHEVIVPQNHLDNGVLAVVFRGPAGLRFQQVTSGFQGVIRALGAFSGPDGGTPTLVAAVVRYTNVLRSAGETQLIMTLPAE